MTEMYPLAFEPVVVEKIWGGRAMERLFGKRLPVGKSIGELWELADLPEGESSVANGPLAGKGLHAVLDEWGDGLLGDTKADAGRFPLLVKFLDANDDLSVQVHPTAEIAARYGGATRLKTEAWYILEARDDAAIYRGLKPGVTPEQFRASLTDGTCPSLLNRVTVAAGDCHFLPSGTLHALGAGVVVAEIQTPSDSTFRAYDWDRPGADGKPRQLHVSQAMECIDFDDHNTEPQPRRDVSALLGPASRVCECEFFTIDRVRLPAGSQREISGDRMTIGIILEGRGRIAAAGTEPLDFKAGDAVLLPAALKQGRLTAATDCLLLEVAVP